MSVVFIVVAVIINHELLLGPDVSSHSLLFIICIHCALYLHIGPDFTHYISMLLIFNIAVLYTQTYGKVIGWCHSAPPIEGGFLCGHKH